MDKLLILSFALVGFIIYVGYVWVKYGVQSSISQSYYLPNMKLPFTLFIWSIGFPVAIVSAGSSPLMMLAAVFILLVGAAPAFHYSQVRIMHGIGAIGGITLAFVSLLVEHQEVGIPVVFLVFTSIATVMRHKNYIWWIEVLAFVLILLGIFIYEV